jgi:signal transduction histidine kinase
VTLHRLLPVDRGWTMALLLILIVVVPATCVVWFMNAAMATQAASARQEVMEAYRDQLRVIRNRVHKHWFDKARALEAAGTGTPEQVFAAVVSRGIAESAIVAGASGRPLYPPVPSGVQSLTWEPGDDATRMARAVLASGAGRIPSGLTRTLVPGVWQMPSPDGRVIGLFSEETVHTAMHAVVDEHQTEMVHFALFAPDEGAYDEAIAIGTAVPGWQASFTLLDTEALGAATRARNAYLFWAGVLSIVTIVVVAVAAGLTFRRQARLARLKTDLVAAVSHELRTPLASMRLLVDGLLRDDSPDPRKTRDYLELISTENGRLSRLIENFLTFSRLERNRHRFEFATVSPAAIARTAVTAMQDRLYPGCVIEVEIDEGLPAIHADADALVGALLNLLDNAYKYTPGEKRIRVRASRDRGEIVFAVADNGIGIPLGEQRRIFRRFYRVDRRLARDTSGVGLGLSIVDEVVRAHRGTVRVASEAGQGSVFTVRLPYLREASA